MLDTDIPLNDPADRPITGILYVRGREMRLCQEIVLGVGGVRALRALGIYARGLAHERGPRGLPGPGARARAGAAAATAWATRSQAVAQNAVFTTHTPVPAGNETFDRELVQPLPRARGSRTSAATPEAALSLGADNGNFNLTVLAIRLSSRVERREPAARRGLLGHVAPPVAGRAREPVGHDHERRAHRELDRPRDARALRAAPATRTGSSTSSSPSSGARVEDDPRRGRSGPPTARRRSGSSASCASACACRRARHGLSPDELRQVEGLLDPHALTIGFARRFATYKRAVLVLSDLDRLRALLDDTAAPGADHLRGQGPPRRPRGPGLHPPAVRC